MPHLAPRAWVPAPSESQIQKLAAACSAASPEVAAKIEAAIECFVLDSITLMSDPGQRVELIRFA